VGCWGHLEAHALAPWNNSHAVGGESFIMQYKIRLHYLDVTLPLFLEEEFGACRCCLTFAFLLKHRFLLSHLCTRIGPAPALAQSTKGKRAAAVIKVLNISGGNGQNFSSNEFPRWWLLQGVTSVITACTSQPCR